MKEVYSDMGNRIGAKLDQAIEVMSRSPNYKWEKVTALSEYWLLRHETENLVVWVKNLLI